MLFNLSSRSKSTIRAITRTLSTVLGRFTCSTSGYPSCTHSCSQPWSLKASSLLKNASLIRPWVNFLTGTFQSLICRAWMTLSWSTHWTTMCTLVSTATAAAKTKSTSRTCFTSYPSMVATAEKASIKDSVNWWPTCWQAWFLQKIHKIMRQYWRLTLWATVSWCHTSTGSMTKFSIRVCMNCGKPMPCQLFGSTLSRTCTST